jgi:hypothetical protein
MKDLDLPTKSAYLKGFVEYLKTNHLGKLPLGIDKLEAIRLLGKPRWQTDQQLNYSADFDVWLENGTVQRTSLKFPDFPYSSDGGWHTPSPILLKALKRIGVEWYPEIGTLLTQSKFIRLAHKENLTLRKYKNAQLFEVVRSRVVVDFYKRRICGVYTESPFAPSAWEPWPK